jgi:hypothetical protein
MGLDSFNEEIGRTGLNGLVLTIVGLKWDFGLSLVHLLLVLKLWVAGFKTKSGCYTQTRTPRRRTTSIVKAATGFRRLTFRVPL